MNNDHAQWVMQEKSHLFVGMFVSSETLSPNL